MLKRLDALLWGIPSILWTAVSRFIEAHAVENSASIAYYFLFSLFPLLILLVALGGHFLQSASVQNVVFLWLNQVFPTASDFIESNLQVVILQRKPASITAIVGLAWAGTGAFSALVRNINRAWNDARPRGFFQSRLMAIAMISVLAALLFASIMLETLLNLAPMFGQFFTANNVVQDWILWFWRSEIFPVLLTFFMFAGLYRWIPNTYVRWQEAGWGALVATIGWRWAIAGFGWYMTSGLSNFQLVYGSVGAVIVLLLWVYISSVITLLGAHLSAAIAHHRRPTI